MITFAYTILYVDDVEQAIAFYEKAFGFKRKFVMEDYGELLTGNTTLSFATTTLARSNFSEDFVESKLSNKPFGIEIAFATDNVQATYDHAILSGATHVAAPSFKPHGQTVAYLRDLDGFLIEICTPMDA